MGTHGSKDFRLYTNGYSNPRLTITSTGNVGIGTTNPGYKLDIYPASGFSGDLFRVGSSTVSNSGMVITTQGNVGIGTASPATALDVNGTITQLTVKSCTLGLTTNDLGSITGCVASDETLKKNINPFTLSLDSVLKLNPVTYQWIDTTTRDSQTHAGFVAQQVEIVLPQAVVPAGQGLKGVDSNAILAVVVNAIKEMEGQIVGILSHQSEQDKQIAQLQAEVKALQTNKQVNACVSF